MPVRGLDQAAASDTAGAQDAVSQAQSQAVKAQSQAERQLDQAKQELDKASQQLRQHMGGMSFSAPGSPLFGQRLQNVIQRVPGQASKPVIIRSSEFDPQEQAKLEEDLAVMSHLLDKTVDEKVGGVSRTRSAMGIDLVFAPFSSPLRSLYLEGYGALFMLHVNFPLLPPPKKAEAQPEKPATDSAWEEARRELYGQPASAGPAEAYSEEKVNKLKDALLEALKDAANIRGLKPEEWVTVCVSGGAGPTAASHKAIVRRNWSGTQTRPTPPTPPKSPEIPPPPAAPSPGQNEVTVVESGSAPPRQSILTLQVKKADAEAFAQGKVSLGEFRKQVRELTYPGTVESGGGGLGGRFGGGGGGGGGGLNEGGF